MPLSQARQQIVEAAYLGLVGHRCRQMPDWVRLHVEAGPEVAVAASAMAENPPAQRRWRVARGLPIEQEVCSVTELVQAEAPLQAPVGMGVVDL
jgi:hypothetical protein